MARNKYPEETVNTILNAAMEVFMEKGYEQTTILDIVDRMGGMTRGAFYHHFKSKEEVLDALGDKLFYENNPFDQLKQRTDLSGLEKLQYLIIHSMDSSDSRSVSVMSVQALNSPVFIKKLLEDNRDVIAPCLEELIREGMEDGSIQTTHPKFLAQLLAFLVNFWMIPTLYPCGFEETMEKLNYIRVVTDQLGVPLLNDEIISILKQQATAELNAF